MKTIRADCTIVDLWVRKNGRLVVDPSGWSTELVEARMKEANQVWAPAGIRFVITHVAVSKPFLCSPESARVDGSSLYLIGKHVNGITFQRGRVSLAFIKEFDPPTDAGGTFYEYAFTGLAMPKLPAQQKWQLAHEMGHLLGLLDDDFSGSIMYGGIPNSGRVRKDQMTIALECRHLR